MTNSILKKMIIVNNIYEVIETFLKIKWKCLSRNSRNNNCIYEQCLYKSRVDLIETDNMSIKSVMYGIPTCTQYMF